jgi:hypothetical protein
LTYIEATFSERAYSASGMFTAKETIMSEVSTYLGLLKGKEYTQMSRLKWLKEMLIKQ